MVLIERNLDVERLISVNLVAFARTVAVPGELIIDVLIAVAVAVTAVIEAFAVGGIASVRSSREGVLIGLHEVELGAEVASDLVGVAVAPAVGSHPQVAILVNTGHGDEVEGGDAAALVFAQIHVPLDGATE
jgi:hypothetical protein